MVRHIVFFRFEDPEVNIPIVRDSLYALRDKIPQIVDMQIASLYKMLKNNDVELNVTEDARALIAQEGYDPQFGARPIKRTIQRLLLNELSKALISQSVNRSKPIVVDRDGDKLKFTN